LIGIGDNSEHNVSLQCMADDAAMSSITVSLSMSPVNITSLSSMHFPDDICLRLCVPRARENSDDICIVVSLLDFTRSAFVELLAL